MTPDERTRHLGYDPQDARQRLQKQAEQAEPLARALGGPAAPVEAQECPVCGQRFRHYHKDTLDGERIVRLDSPRQLPIPTSSVALTVSTLTPEALDRHIAAMEPETLAEFSLRAAAIAKVASRAKQVANLRLVDLGQTGQVFTDPADGTPYCLTGGRHRRIKDIPGFVEQLAADGIDARPLIPWLSSSAFRVGETIEGDYKVKAAVKEWAVWEDDPVSLVELDKVTMKPVKR